MNPQAMSQMQSMQQGYQQSNPSLASELLSPRALIEQSLQFSAMGFFGQFGGGPGPFAGPLQYASWLWSKGKVGGRGATGIYTTGGISGLRTLAAGGDALNPSGLIMKLAGEGGLAGRFKEGSVPWKIFQMIGGGEKSGAIEFGGRTISNWLGQGVSTTWKGGVNIAQGANPFQFYKGGSKILNSLTRGGTVGGVLSRVNSFLLAKTAYDLVIGSVNIGFKAAGGVANNAMRMIGSLNRIGFGISAPDVGDVSGWQTQGAANERQRAIQFMQQSHGVMQALGPRAHVYGQEATQQYQYM